MLPLVSATLEVLSSVRLATGVAAVGTVSVSVAVGSGIVPGASPVAVAVFAREPAVTSAAVITYVLPVAAQLAVAPGARLAIVHDKPGSSGSLTVTGASVTVPVLVALKA